MKREWLTGALMSMCGLLILSGGVWAGEPNKDQAARVLESEGSDDPASAVVEAMMLAAIEEQGLSECENTALRPLGFGDSDTGFFRWVDVGEQAFFAIIEGEGETRVLLLVKNDEGMLDVGLEAVVSAEGSDILSMAPAVFTRAFGIENNFYSPVRKTLEEGTDVVTTYHDSVSCGPVSSNTFCCGFVINGQPKIVCVCYSNNKWVRCVEI